MEEKINLVIKRIIKKNYPNIIDFEVMRNPNPFRENSYEIIFQTSDHISQDESRKIQEQTFLLFRMLNPMNEHFFSTYPSIRMDFQSNGTSYRLYYRSINQITDI